MEERFLSRCSSLAQMIMEEIAEAEADAGTCVRDLMECLMLTLLRYSSDNAPSSTPHGFAEVALRYLYTHFREKPSVEEIAEVCGYTPNYFSRLFHSLTGRSYTDFLNTLRINHAVMLLRSTQMSVTEIAFGCGFSSLSNFYRVFRRETGHSPSFYRNSRT
jgi:AraC-like DNA-binding protein